MCWAAFALDAEESGWDDFMTSSPSLSVSDDATRTGSTNSAISPISVAAPLTPTSASIPVTEDQIWTSELTKFEPPAVWHKEIGAVPVTEPVIVDTDVDMVMDLDLDVEIQQVQSVSVTDVVVSSPSEHHIAAAGISTPPRRRSIVTPSEQQEWIKTIDAQIEQSQRQLEFTTVEISRVEEVIKPGKRYIPTKITAYFPSSPILSLPALNLEVRQEISRESEEERRQREILEELAKSLSSVSLRTRARTQQVAKAKPPPIGIGMMMGFKSSKSETPSPKFKAKEAEMHTKITKRGVIGGTRGGAGKVRGAMRRRNSTGKNDTICL
ncbi:hypothetical protein ABW19_dt0206666 [Dactylella cylindrospora]|nr:hypothetical protein ABW19_dt0206666 [Dactylella cylindrospora]